MLSKQSTKSTEAEIPEIVRLTLEGMAPLGDTYAHLDGESINGIDATAINTITELNDELKRADVELRFARVRANVMEIMQRSDLVEIIGSDHFYISIQDGVDAFLAEQVEQPDEAVPPETEESD